MGAVGLAIAQRLRAFGTPLIYADVATNPLDPNWDFWI